MNLAHDSEFVGSQDGGPEFISKVKKFVKQFIARNGHADARDPAAILEETAVEFF